MTNTALIGLDYIVDIMGDNGTIASSSAEARRRDVIAHFNVAKAVADDRDWLTILIKVGFESGYHDQPKNSPIFGTADQFGALDLSGPGTDFHPDLDVTGHEVVLTKPRISGFFNTRLQSVLDASNIDRLVIAGVSTTWAVQATARDAHDRDFATVIVEDACAASTEESHEQSITMLKSIAMVVKSTSLTMLRA